MSNGRFDQYPENFKNIIILVQEAYVPLKDKIEISEEKDLAPYNQAQGVKDFKDNPEIYEINVSKILDFFILKIPDIFNKVIKENYSGLWPTAQAMNAVLKRCDQFINPAARYLDNREACVPYITSDRLYRKMQWIEWFLIKMKEKGETLSLIVKHPLNQFINKRLFATTKRLDEYAAFRSFKRISIYDLEMQYKEQKAAPIVVEEYKAKNKAADAQVVMDEKNHDETSAADESDSDDEFFDCIEEANTPCIAQAKLSIGKESIQTAADVSLSLELSDDESEDEEDHFVDAKESFETEHVSPTVQAVVPSEQKKDGDRIISLSDPVSSSPILAVAEIKSASLQQAKTNINRVIDEHIERVRDPRLKLYDKDPVERRARELKKKVNGAIDMESLENCIAEFIRTGQTESDNAFQRSYTIAENCLRRMIIDAFCPQFFDKTRNYISPLLFSKEIQIQSMLNLCPDEMALQKVLRMQ